MNPPRLFPSRSRGVALILVLAFVLLASGIVVAALSRAMAMRRASSNSSFQARADDLARSSLTIIVSSLKQEIVNGSDADTSGGCTLYVAKKSDYLAPQRNGSWTGIPNLLRVSSGTRAPWPAADFIEASDADTGAVSVNGRSITPAQWNQHYLVPRKSPSKTAQDATPVADFPSPAWIYVTAQGPAVLSAPAKAAIGRYAYAIYDESGLLDANVAGFPSSCTDAQIGGKGPLAFADLYALNLSNTYQIPKDQIDDLVGWRHRVTAQASGSFGKISFAPTGAGAFCQAMLAETGGFLRVSGSATVDGQTDQAIINRQALLELRRCIGFTQNALQYLGTFSRAVTAPSVFPSVRFASGGTLRHYHDDGAATDSEVSAGEPLLQTRFSLGKLAWVTASGTPSGSITSRMIQDYFGLRWSTDRGCWEYTGPGCASAGHIKTLGEVAAEAAPREPDFFELLKAGIDPAPADFQIIQIGANLIDQADEDTTPTAIYFAGETGGTARGVESAEGHPTPNGPPVVLNRKLRSAGEMGYALRDGMTATLDFCSAQSSDARLLDLFSAVDEPAVAAGKLNPARAQAAALKAVLAGTFTKESEGKNLGPTAAQTLAVQLASRLAASPPADSSGLVAAIGSGTITDLESKAATEAPIRALAPVTNTRTWNVMVDLVAQTGVFPPRAASLNAFVVQSERRYWLHLAIDRLTGKVVDQQLEAVSE